MNSAGALIVFFAAAAYFVAKRRGRKPWVYVVASVPISVAVYVAVVIGVSLMAN